MKGRFTEQELTDAGAGLMKTMLDENIIERENIPVLVAQIGICIQLVLHQPQEAWDAVPEGISPEQLVLFVFLMQMDEAHGTNMVDQVLERAQELHNDRIPSLDDITGFQA